MQNLAADYGDPVPWCASLVERTMLTIKTPVSHAWFEDDSFQLGLLEKT